MGTKKFLLAFVAMMMPLFTSAEEVEIDGICYSLNKENSSAEIVKKGFEQYTGDVEIPGSFTYNKVVYHVTSIGSNAFYGCKNLTSIKIPDSITSIGLNAFEGCTGLKAVHIKDIASWCNMSFSTVKETVAESLMDLLYNFSNTSNPLVNAHHLYIDNKEVIDLIIPESVTSINAIVFDGCSYLNSVTIPKTVKSIGYNAFSGCVNLKSVHIEDLEAWCNLCFYSGCLYRYSVVGYSEYQFSPASNPLSFAHHLFLNGQEIKDLTIPEGVGGLNSIAFYGCSELVSVVIPKSMVIHLKDRLYGDYYDGSMYHPIYSCCPADLSFYGCSNVTSLIFDSPETYMSSFKNSPLIETVTFKGNTQTIEDKIPDEWKNLNTVNIECSSIGKSFKGITTIKNINIEKRAKSVEAEAFNGCKNVIRVKLGSNISEIGERSFANIDKLTEVVCLAEDVPNTDRTAFENSYIDYATLYVPSSSIDKYRSTAPWSNFKSIVAVEEEQKIFNLTYMVDGNVYKSYKVEYGEEIIPETVPQKDGYTFSGWNGLPEIMPDNDVTVFGTFVVNSNKYKLVYIVDGNVYKSYEIKSGSTIIPESDPVKDGYTFSGWSEIPEEMPAHDVTITGTFTRDPLGTCPPPTIQIIDGEVVFSCETDDVEYHYDIEHLDVKSGDGNNIKLSGTYRISVYVSKDGYEDSEVVTKDVRFKKGDLNGDDKVNAADVVELTNIIMSGSE